MSILTVVNCVWLCHLSVLAEGIPSPSLLVQRIRTNAINVRSVVVVRIAIVIHIGEISRRNACLDGTPIKLSKLRPDFVVALTPTLYQSDFSVDSVYTFAKGVQIGLEHLGNHLKFA